MFFLIFVLIFFLIFFLMFFLTSYNLKSNVVDPEGKTVLNTAKRCRRNYDKFFETIYYITGRKD